MLYILVSMNSEPYLQKAKFSVSKFVQRERTTSVGVKYFSPEALLPWQADLIRSFAYFLIVRVNLLLSFQIVFLFNVHSILFGCVPSTCNLYSKLQFTVQEITWRYISSGCYFLNWVVDYNYFYFILNSIISKNIFI